MCGSRGSFAKRCTVAAAASLLLSRSGVATTKGQKCDAETGSCPAAAAPASGTPGVMLMQIKNANVAKKATASRAQQGSAAQEKQAPESSDAAAIASLANQVSELKELVRAMQLSLTSKLDGCCGDPGPCGYPPSSDVSDGKDLPGLCAVFGDPHFTTFDGAHTILLAEKVIWLVKSARVWVQAYARETTGNLMGIAVGGPFMKGHHFVLYNSTEHGGLRALYDGVPILEDVDANGNAEYQDAFRFWAARRDDWDMSLHDQAILEMDQPVNFTVASWPGRFKSAPEGGLFLFRFPNNIELTATGVDFMSAVVKMTKESSGQTGYCGNFDGDDVGESEPPEEGSVPPNLVDAWNTPKGEGLEDVEDKVNLFLRTQETVNLVHHNQDPNAAMMQIRDAPRAWSCSEDRMDQAEEECKGVEDEFMYEACIIDFCLTGAHVAAQDAGSAEVMQEIVNHRGIPVFVGHGRCRDKDGDEFTAIRVNGVRRPEECKSLLHDVSAVKGVVGAQLRLAGNCEIVADTDADFAHLKTLISTESWEEVESHGENGQARRGRNFISSVVEDLTWSCWRLN